MNSASELGATLQRTRKSHGLTQEQLAELAGISERTLRSIERGAGNPSIEAVLSVVEVLGLRIVVTE
ncbi:helix-turn-helix transcriptional regulator [Arthrobacter sp. NIO-1057]|uniref:helix-turn-helix transcriptional regulator n=1 Tax=Arthrobacter sp. NIO-1057 TaxID=993071 RepID=UPI00071D5DEB|nr:helix-turn-helix transcriptional regulator [Arthrobacter sp. NIO-1057]KSU62005.1 XRE family transcriptional regulator [Arthrobacter sp. NIO-1057]SCC53995.1 transcriptional regulator, y4mF family [Arthrobacter sp. NIO-1057]